MKNYYIVPFLIVFILYKNMFWRSKTLAFYTIITIVMVSFFLLLCIPMQLLNAPYAFRYKVSEVFSYIFIYLIWVICGIKYKVEGQEHLPKDGKPYLALANHQSFWENFFMQLIIPKHSWVIKRELEVIPVLGWGIKSVQPIAVDRNNSQSVSQILREGAKKIDANLSLVMFPEATRVKVNKSVKFKASAAKLAINTGVPVVLIAHNAGLVWPKGFWFKQPGTVTVKIIEYISAEKVASFDARELTAYIQDNINIEKNKLVELGV
jgi:1-acyl-sn-glycerol-3-phosphate acyltransferase